MTIILPCIRNSPFDNFRPHNSALSVLIIRRSKKRDAGVYRCNLSGSSTRHKYMILNVTGKALSYVCVSIDNNIAFVIFRSYMYILISASRPRPYDSELRSCILVVLLQNVPSSISTSRSISSTMYSLRQLLRGCSSFLNI